MKPRVPGAAQHKRSAVMRRRPGTVTRSEFGTVPDQQCIVSRHKAAFGRRLRRREAAAMALTLHRVRDTKE
jgi:hypothetical protein